MSLYPSKEKRFNELLQEYSNDLYCKWIKEDNRWGIYSQGKTGKEYLIFKAETPDGGYKDIDRRELRAIAEADLQQKSKSFSLSDDIIGHNEAHEADQYKELRNSVMAIAKEQWRHRMGHPVVGVS